MATTRKYLLDDAKQGELCALLTLGMSRRAAAEFVGCHVETIRRHARRDAAFAERLARAEKRLEMAQLQGIQAAAQETKNWRAAAWLLERRYPERYAAQSARRVAARRVRAVLDEVGVLLAEILPQEARLAVAERLAQLSRRWSGGSANEEAP